MRFFETHAHLHVAAFDNDRDLTLARAREAGVRRLVNVGFDLPSSHASVDLASRYADIYATVGVQPHYAEEVTPETLQELEALLSAPKVVALGEIGLDYYHDRAPRPAQRNLFELQLHIAVEHRMPVVIHSREAHDDTVAVLREGKLVAPVVMHSFSGDWSYAKACLDLGAYLSFSGPVTFPKSTELQEVARLAPIDRILIETDCPYLSPHPFRGKRNEPERVRVIATALAGLRGVPVDELADALWRNSCAVFGLPEQPENDNGAA
jgi:TatD DNase family protein